MKKTICLILCFTILLPLTGCKGPLRNWIFHPLNQPGTSWSNEDHTIEFHVYEDPPVVYHQPNYSEDPDHWANSVACPAFGTVCINGEVYECFVIGAEFGLIRFISTDVVEQEANGKSFYDVDYLYCLLVLEVDCRSKKRFIGHTDEKLAYEEGYAPNAIFAEDTSYEFFRQDAGD